VKTNTLGKGLLALFLFISTSYAAQSNLDKLVKENNIQELSRLIKNTKVIEDDTQIPDNPKDNDLIIMENEYDVKILFEYLNNEWNEKSGALIADVLNDQKSTYIHLFNYKVSNKDFNPYVSDKESVKVSNEDKKVVVKILKSKFNDKAINSTIKVYSQKHLIGAEDVINIQVVNIKENVNEISCNLIFSYKE